MTKAFDEVVAVFEPVNEATLRDRARPLIGRRLRWRALWPISDDDGGPYAGQWAWEPVGLTISEHPGWVPTEDLRIAPTAPATGQTGGL